MGIFGKRSEDAAQLIAAGISCSGPPEHHRARWQLRPDRVLEVAGNDGSATVLAPPPGEAALVAFDAHRLHGLLSNGEAWRWDSTNAICRDMDGVKTEDAMAKKGGPALIAGGSGCGGVLWVADGERRLWSWSPAGRAPIGGPVPGDAAILAVDPAERTVVLADGSRLNLIGSQWVPMGTDGTLRCRVLDGFCLGGVHGDVVPGQLLELGEREARPLIASGRLEPVA